ncbi:MAG: hypothetical protein HYS89_01530 [Candidatus Colwellbacteria bacterium]|nr:hypothetical protein [Candidatus Colwellbacteria bacterium]
MAKKDVHAMVAGMGLAAGFIETLVTKARARGVSDEAIRRLGTPEGEALIDLLIEEMARQSWPTVVGPYRTVILYHVPIEDLIQEGAYGPRARLVGVDDTPSRSIHAAEREFFLLCPEQKMSDQAVRQIIADLGFRPADQRELLSFGRVHPGEQLKFDIAGLGTVDKNGSCLVLTRMGEDRALVATRVIPDWGEDVRFLIIRR